MVASTTSLPTPSPGRIAILCFGMRGSLLFFFGLVFRELGLGVFDEAAGGDDAEDGLGQRMEGEGPLGRADLAAGEVEVDMIAGLEPVGRLFALEDGEAEVDGVAEIDAGGGLGHHGLDPGGLEAGRGLL